MGINPNEVRLGNIYRRRHGKGYTDEAMSFETLTKILSPNPELAFNDFDPIEINSEWLTLFGYKFYNGRTDGDMTLDYGGRLDIDFVDGKIKVKSHYETEIMYRELSFIKYIHQLQNLYYSLTGRELYCAVAENI